MRDNRERERKIKMAKWANFFNQSNISNVIVYEHNDRLQWEKSTDHTHNNFQYQSKKKIFIHPWYNVQKNLEEIASGKEIVLACKTSVWQEYWQGFFAKY